MDHDCRSGDDAAKACASCQLQPQRGAARCVCRAAKAAPAKRRLAPNTLEGFQDWLFELLDKPVGELGCAGPPDCKTCPGGEHDTGLGMFQRVIEVEIDEWAYEIHIKRKKTDTGV